MSVKSAWHIPSIRIAQETPWQVWLAAWLGILQATAWIFSPKVLPGALGLLVLLAFVVLTVAQICAAVGTWNFRRQRFLLLVVLAILTGLLQVVSGVWNVTLGPNKPLFLVIWLFSGPPVAVMIVLLYLSCRDRLDDLKARGLAHQPPLEEQVSKPREWTESLFIAFLIAMFLRTFVVQAFTIPSSSMEDTLLVGDYLLVNKFIYGTQVPIAGVDVLAIREVQRGDVIVFEYPEDRQLPPFERKDFIKRVVGLPGEVIEIRDKSVFINGEPYSIPQAVHKDERVFGAAASNRDSFGPFEVPDGEYFVMGDNRDNSHDSRFWGTVPEEAIRGLAFIKHWSWDRAHGEIRWDRIGRPVN